MMSPWIMFNYILIILHLTKRERSTMAELKDTYCKTGVQLCTHSP